MEKEIWGREKGKGRAQMKLKTFQDMVPAGRECSGYAGHFR